ncbi:MAG: hypothetical protein HOP29_09265 [Phycisphaerales bacterium]|nr:hypothetical protein [Phycisphaerales bacterium]
MDDSAFVSCASFHRPIPSIGSSMPTENRSRGVTGNHAFETGERRVRRRFRVAGDGLGAMGIHQLHGDGRY